MNDREVKHIVGKSLDKRISKARIDEIVGRLAKISNNQFMKNKEIHLKHKKENSKQAEMKNGIEIYKSEQRRLLKRVMITKNQVNTLEREINRIKKINKVHLRDPMKYKTVPEIENEENIDIPLSIENKFRYFNMMNEMDNINTQSNEVGNLLNYLSQFASKANKHIKQQLKEAKEKTGMIKYKFENYKKRMSSITKDEVKPLQIGRAHV